MAAAGCGGVRPSVDENRCCTELFEAEIGRATHRARSMANTSRNGHALPGAEPDLPSTFQIDRKTSRDHNEQLVGTGMVVPTIRFLENREPQTTIVHLSHDHVPVRLGDRRTLAGQVDDFQRGIANGLVGVAFCRWVDGGCHSLSLPESLLGHGKKKLNAVNPGYPAPRRVPGARGTLCVRAAATAALQCYSRGSSARGMGHEGVY